MTRGSRFLLLLGGVLVVLAFGIWLCWQSPAITLRYHFWRIEPYAPLLLDASRRHFEAVLQQGENTRDWLRAQLDVSHPVDASKAALLLAHMGDVDSAPQIRNLLAHGLVRTGSHWQGSPVHFGPNAEAVGITWLRRNSAEALGVLKDADAIQPLCMALRSPDYETRRAAEQSLLQIGDRSGTYNYISSLLSDGTWLYKPGQKEPFKRVCDLAVDVVEKLSGEAFGSYPSRNAEPDEALQLLNRRVEECRGWLSVNS